MNNDLGKSENEIITKKTNPTRRSFSRKEKSIEINCKNPKRNPNYIALIYLYSNSNQSEKRWK
jgi:hypothetical protein